MYIEKNDGAIIIECDCGAGWDYTNTLCVHEPRKCPSCLKEYTEEKIRKAYKKCHLN